RQRPPGGDPPLRPRPRGSGFGNPPAFLDTMSRPEIVDHAERVAAMLDEFIGLLFIARSTDALWGVRSQTSDRSRARLVNVRRRNSDHVAPLRRPLEASRPAAT